LSYNDRSEIAMKWTSRRRRIAQIKSTAGAVAIAVAADSLAVLREAVLRYGRAGETSHGKEQN
jgi:hypothetical protein